MSQTQPSINKLEQLKQQYNNFEHQYYQPSNLHNIQHEMISIQHQRSSQEQQERQRNDQRKDDLETRLRKLVDLGERTD